MPRSLVISKNGKQLLDTTVKGGQHIGPFRPVIVENSPFIETRIQGNEHIKGGDLTKLAVLDDKDNVSQLAFDQFLTDVIKTFTGDVEGQRAALVKEITKLADKAQLKKTVIGGAEAFLHAHGKAIKAAAAGEAAEEEETPAQKKAREAAEAEEAKKNQK